MSLNLQSGLPTCLHTSLPTVVPQRYRTYVAGATPAVKLGDWKDSLLDLPVMPVVEVGLCKLHLPAVLDYHLPLL